MKISVIIPTFNRGKSIEKALQSVFVQTYKPHEIIVVDDGSTDETSDILKAYREKIIYVRRKNSGKPGIARNTGLSYVTGDWIAFLDSDDIWVPKKLELQKRFIGRSRKTLGIVFGDYIKIKNSDKITRSSFFSKEDIDKLSLEIVKGGCIFKKDLFLYYLLYKNPIHTSSVLMNRNMLDLVAGFDSSLTIAEDRDLWIRCAKEKNVGYLNEVLCKYFLEKDNITQDSILYLNDLSKVICKYYKMQNTSIPDDIKEKIKFNIGKIFRTLSFLTAKKGLKYQGIKAMLSSIKFSKLSLEYLVKMIVILISPKLYEYLHKSLKKRNFAL